jgi:hypothetical protein
VEGIVPVQNGDDVVHPAGDPLPPGKTPCHGSLRIIAPVYKEGYQSKICNIYY